MIFVLYYFIFGISLATYVDRREMKKAVPFEDAPAELTLRTTRIAVWILGALIGPAVFPCCVAYAAMKHPLTK